MQTFLNAFLNSRGAALVDAAPQRYSWIELPPSCNLITKQHEDFPAWFDKQLDTALLLHYAGRNTFMKDLVQLNEAATEIVGTRAATRHVRSHLCAQFQRACGGVALTRNLFRAERSQDIVSSCARPYVCHLPSSRVSQLSPLSCVQAQSHAPITLGSGAVHTPGFAWRDILKTHAVMQKVIDAPWADAWLQARRLLDLPRPVPSDVAASDIIESAFKEWSFEDAPEAAL